MSLDAVLSSGLQTISGCRSLCYVDMPTRLVLATKSHKPQPQEVFDRIACNARTLFQGEGIPAALVTEPNSRRVFLFHDQTVEIYAQPSGEPEHAICCTCDMQADLAVIAEQVETVRAGLSGAFR